MEGRLREPFRLSGGEWLMSFTTRGDAGKIYDMLKDADVDVEIRKHNPKRSKDANAMCWAMILLKLQIKKHNPKRSKDANSMCWAMCSDIGNALRPPLPKEEVYRRAIREVGEYEPLPIRADAVETFQRRWAAKGTGWFAEVIDDSKLPGYKLVFAYYGSSTYDSATMGRLIDFLVDDARQMGLNIPASKEQEEALKAWGAKA